MAIYKGQDQIGGIYRGDSSIGTVHHGEDLVYNGSIPAEWGYIEIEVDSSEGSYIIPLSGIAANGSSYSLSISVNGMYKGDYIGTVNIDNGTGIEITGLIGNTTVLRIEPSHSIYAGWGMAFSYYSNLNGCNTLNNKAKLLRVINDPDFAHLLSINQTGNYFRASQFYSCTSLEKAVDESLPETVVNIGSHFRFEQYNRCSSLSVASKESIPTNLSSIGPNFRQSQYYDCQSLLIGDYIHSHHFKTLLNADTSNYMYMFQCILSNTSADSVPGYYTDSSHTTMAPITDLTPASSKRYLINRIGIEGYDELDNNWK